MIDMFQITEAFDKYKSSMEKVGKTIGTYSSNTLLDKSFLSAEMVAKYKELIENRFRQMD